MARPGGSLLCAIHDKLLAYVPETCIRKMNFNPVSNSIDIEVDSHLEVGFGLKE
jgi:hypothetical protein